MLALALPAQAQEGTRGTSQLQQQKPQPEQEQQAQPPQEGQQSVEVETNLFCGTQQQVARFMSLLDENGGSAEAAITAVNAENKTPDACAIATVAYRRAGIAGEVKNVAATFDVMRIVVMGVYTVKGFEAALPMELFTLVPRNGGDGTVGRRPEP
ncbi:MAG: hypothetical protein GEU95_04030 [Rhizobiales bacterium]|nr:hypothetical protein [Hyphomicrobiales bacterium]